jgi:hypothetical protein
VFDEKDVRARAKTIYEIDEIDVLRCAHKNPQVQEIYSSYFGNPEAIWPSDYYIQPLLSVMFYYK